MIAPDVALESRGLPGAKLLLWGSGIAFVLLLVPGLYGVSYSPPKGFRLHGVKSSTLENFNGVYSGFHGPADTHPIVLSVVATFVLGLAVLMFRARYEGAFKRRFQALLFVSHASLGPLPAILFLWGFRRDQTPQSIRQSFIKLAGGSQAAVQASHYVTANVGLTALLIVCALIAAMIGTYPKVYGVIAGAFLVFVGGVLFYHVVVRGAY